MYKDFVLLVYLNGKAWMHIFTCGQTLHASPKSSTASALRGKGYVMVNVLAPLHQQVRIHIIFPFRGAPQYFLAHFPWLLTQWDLLFWMTVSTAF